jgi:serine/threonine-protein kinase HipA
MNTPPPTDHLAVHLQTPAGVRHLVGVLHRTRDHSWFESAPEYWELADRPVLGQVFEQHDRLWKPDANVRLPRWFSHLLPEGRLREAIASDAGVNSEREFALLQRIGGDDLPGALRAYECDEDGLPPDVTARKEPTQSSLPDVLKFSLAGVQLKFSVRETDRGLTVPSKDASGDWIAKLPDPRPGFEFVPEAEFAGLELARAAGIETAEVRLVVASDITGLPDWAPTDQGNALLVKRYDRFGPDGRVHAEEFAQILDVPTGGAGKFKYDCNFETIAKTAFAFSGLEGLGGVIDRLVLNTLVGNGDAHTKNWSFVYRDGRTPTLSPAYDIVPTVAFIKHDNLGLKLNGSLRFEDVTTRAFARLAEKAGGAAEWGRERAQAGVDRVVDSWNVLKEALPSELYDRITDHRSQLSLVK